VPGNYQFTARENIALGNLEAASEPGRVESSAWSAGAHHIIQRLPKGYDSLLGRWFPEGTELSGGEWQRIALARAFVRQAHMMLLDEPTSAMDSWSETDWYTRLQHLAEGRTVVLATHRLTIARRADFILVMSGGGIVESGSHEELLAIGGLYAQSWVDQTASRDEHSQVQVANA
jgi:ATP-binding cassette subfamily B protein